MPSSTRAAGYAALVKTYGAGEIADRLLARWLADDEADQQWEHLRQDVDRARPYRPYTHSWTVELPPDRGGSQLSNREVSVLEAAANGLTVRATAERVYMSEQTIKDYRKAIFRKLGARNITHAVALYWRASS